MDALRGGFGTIGSILRARSVTRMNSISSAQGGGLPFSNSGWEGMPRYQRVYIVPAEDWSLSNIPLAFSVSDAPIHDDTADEFALKSMSMSFQPFAPRSRNPTLKVSLCILHESGFTPLRIAHLQSLTIKISFINTIERGTKTPSIRPVHTTLTVKSNMASLIERLPMRITFL
jgi:hypothetical protein